MQGPMEALVTGILMRGLSPALTAVLMAAPSRKTVRAQLKKIYVLDDRGDMTGEYVLDADCRIDYDDFLKVLPPEGIGDRDSLFVGEYVFTAFQSGKLVFVLLSRGHLASEDVDWTALLLTAADSHLAPASRAAPPRTEAKPDPDKASAEREVRLKAREKPLEEQEVKLQAESANLLGRQEELNRQKAGLTALADYAARMQDSVTRGVSRAMKTLEMTEQLTASRDLESKKTDSKATSDAQQAFEQERNAPMAAKNEVDVRYREATAQIAKFEREARDAITAPEKERANANTRLADEERTRKEIEGRVADMSQRFAAMAKERLLASPPAPGGEGAGRDRKEGEEGGNAPQKRV